MSEFSLKEILLLIFGGVGGVTGIVGFGKFVLERLDAARKRKKELLETHSSIAIEARRVELVEDERALIEVWRIVEDKKKEIELIKLEVLHLKDVILQMDTNNSLSRPTITNLYAAARTLRKRINKVDILIDEAHCANPVEDLRAEMTNLKTSFNELEALLP